jgi:hypothetical protein
MDKCRMATSVHTGLDAARIAERRRAREAHHAAHRRLIVAAGVDPAKLSQRGGHVLYWLADWDEPTIEGLVEILGAVRMAAQVAKHRAGLQRKVAVPRQSEAAPEAALTRYEERWGAGQ